MAQKIFQVVRLVNKTLIFNKKRKKKRLQDSSEHSVHCTLSSVHSLFDGIVKNGRRSILVIISRAVRLYPFFIISTFIFTKRKQEENLFSFFSLSEM